MLERGFLYCSGNLPAALRATAQWQDRAVGLNSATRRATRQSNAEASATPPARFLYPLSFSATIDSLLADHAPLHQIKNAATYACKSGFIARSQIDTQFAMM